MRATLQSTPATRGGNATVRIAGARESRAARTCSWATCSEPRASWREVSSRDRQVDSARQRASDDDHAGTSAHRRGATDAWARRSRGVSKVVEFFDGRQLRVAGIARALLLRGDLYLRNGNAGRRDEGRTSCARVAQSLQGEKPYSSLTGQAMLLTARIHEHRGEVETARSVAAQAVHAAERDARPSASGHAPGPGLLARSAAPARPSSIRTRKFSPT